MHVEMLVFDMLDWTKYIELILLVAFYLLSMTTKKI